MIHNLPPTALSVRQPWAWAIIHAQKDIENRSTGAVRHMPNIVGKRIAIHAAKGMTREEYESARDFMASINVTCPPADALLRGCIIGSVEVIGIVKQGRDHIQSPWFFGPCGLMLRRPISCPFVPARGALGIFEWTPGGTGVEPPAKWMTLAAPGAAKDETGTLI